MIIQKCKGAYDLLPSDMEQFRYLESVFRESALKWGYQEVRTPSLEYLHLFTSAGTLSPAMLNRVYSFLDWDGWSGERVVLRPDGTIPVVRLFNENLAHLDVAKLFYITSVFGFEDTGTKNRERWQLGVELIGGNTVLSDLEVLILGYEILIRLNCGQVKLRLSHAGVLRSLIKELKLGDEAESRLFGEIRDGNWDALRMAGKKKPAVSAVLSLLLNLKGNTSGFLQNARALSRSSAEFKAQIDDFLALTTKLDAMCYPYEIDMTSSKGFEYYTGLCFQFLLKDKRIGGGGRYDGLVPLMGGKNKPACGFALYADYLMEMMSVPSETKEKWVLIRSGAMTDQTAERCFELARSLHAAGYVAGIDFDGDMQDCQFTVLVESKKPYFSVVNTMKKKTITLSSISEVIDEIGGSVVRKKKAARKAN